MNNNSNNCCCSIGLKEALCILKSFKNLNLVGSTQTFYNYGSSTGTIEDSPYPNLLFLKEVNTNSYLCLENVNYIKIVPTDKMYSSIIYELGKNYDTPFCLEVPNFESCCCKVSSAAFMKDKYLQFDPTKRRFTVKFSGLDTTRNILPQPQQSLLSVYVLYLDCDIAWLSDDTHIFIASLCNISLLID